MTDKYFALTVILEDTILPGDAQYIMNAIEMIKGVQGVEPLVATPETYWARAEARRELERKLWLALKQEEK